MVSDTISRGGAALRRLALVRFVIAAWSCLGRPALARRSARGIITVLLIAKLAATLYNVAVANTHMYDKSHHLARAESAGLEVTRRFYNPPLYYLPIRPFINNPKIIPEKGAKRQNAIVNFYRTSNLAYMALFYVCWIYVIFPAALPGWRSSFLASLALLSLPGYQRVAKMVHPDNLLCALTALSFALWIIAERKTRTDPAGEARTALSWKWVVGLALVIGLTGASRPFAIVPVVVFTLASAWILVWRQRHVWRQLLTKGLIAASLVAALSGTWWAYRLATLPSALTDVYFGVGTYGPHRETFDWKHYFTSFYLKELLDTPNRHYRKYDKDSASSPRNRTFFQNEFSNSFHTLLYSEVWGDHWLYFSGGKERDQRVDTKRLILSAALVPTIALVIRALWSLGFFLYCFVRRRWPSLPQTVLLALLACGLALYIKWQTGDALKPGKQSTVKFIYIAYLFPALMALPFVKQIRGVWFNLFATMLALLFLVTFPMSLALDSG